nr:hypothetical protein [Neorhizobium tomejilense]
MRDGTRSFMKVFPEETIEVVRVIHGVPGSTLGRVDSRETLRMAWGRETNSRIEIYINDHFVADRGTYGDTGSVGTSIKNAMEDWRSIVEDFEAGPDDKVVVIIESWIEDVPTFGLNREERWGGNYYFTMPQNSAPFFLDVPPEGLAAMADEDLRTLKTRHHSKTIVASSKWTAEQCEAAAAAFVARADEPTRTETDGFDYYC